MDAPEKDETDDPGLPLLRRFREGDETAFNELYAKYHKSVRRFARTMLEIKHKTYVDEVSQKTWTAVIEGAETFAGRSTVEKWILGIAANTCLGEYRKRKRARETELAPDQGRPDRGAADRSAAALDLEAQIGALPFEERAAVLLRHYENLSFKEISERTGVPVTTVQTRVARALEKMRDRLASWSPRSNKERKEET
jgi:RNA polymerase sigma-70 factor (ECF subfamily)